jgi:hypothetical protein
MQGGRSINRRYGSGGAGIARHILLKPVNVFADTGNKRRFDGIRHILFFPA